MHEPAGGHNLKRLGDVIPVQCSAKRVKHDAVQRRNFDSVELDRSWNTGEMTA